MAWVTSFAKPKNRVVIQVFWIGQPASFVKVVARRTINRVVLSRPRHVGQKFRDDEAVGCQLDVLAIRPPAEIVNFLNVLIRALKERNVVLKKIPSGAIRNISGIKFMIIRVEGINVMLERLALQNNVMNG